MTAVGAVDAFIEGVAAVRMADCFNPYADDYPPFDIDEAASVRRSNLRHVLSAAADQGVADLWIGLELGHNGGRRTGLAMTDDAHLLAHGERFGVSQHLRQATKSGPAREMTANIVWEALGRTQRPIFLWNVVPVHPHRKAEPLSNRRHTPGERDICLPYLRDLIALLKPKQLVTVGGHASLALKRCGYSHIPVRHPAFGGKREFLEQVAALD